MTDVNVKRKNSESLFGDAHAQRSRTVVDDAMVFLQEIATEQAVHSPLSSSLSDVPEVK